MIKKMILCLCSLLAFCSASFAENCEETACSDSIFIEQFKYVKLGGGIFTYPDCMAGPAVSLGWRFQEENHALDISANYAGISRSFMVTLPKAVYLQYLNPNSKKSMYVGGGLSFGWMNQHSSKKSFTGLMAEFVVGYDFNRFGKTKLFTELTITQSMLKVSHKNRYQAPVMTVTCGVGF